MEILQIIQTPSGRWQNTLQSDQLDSDQPVALGPEFDSEMDAQKWLWLHGPEKARRMKVTINGIERWLRQSDSPMTCEKIAELAGMNGHLTMTYHVRISGDTVRQGTLIAGESLELAHGMRISVADTSNA